MIYAISNTGEKILPSPKIKATCPACGGETLSKCGKLKIWHWAHKVCDCDPWYEPMSEWHLGWQNQAPPENCEVVIGPHRADVKGARGVVVELQNSQISPETIVERENFYGKMIWIVNAQKFVNNLYFNRYVLYGFDSKTYCRWEKPRKSWLSAKMPVCLDIGMNKKKMLYEHSCIPVRNRFENRFLVMDTNHSVPISEHYEINGYESLILLKPVTIKNSCFYGVTFECCFLDKKTVVEKYFK